MSFFTPNNLQSVTSGRWLKRGDDQFLLHGVGIDTRSDLTNKAYFAIRGQQYDGHDFLGDAVAAGAKMLFVDRDVDDGVLAHDVSIVKVSDSVTALGRMARAYRQTLNSTKVIAITGSAGKTTAKRLIEAVLSGSLRGTAAPRSFNNNIGLPLSILRAEPKDNYLILEIGANTPGEIAHLSEIAMPDIAVITMIGRSHLEGFGTVENVAREKASMLLFLKRGGLKVLHADSPELARCIKAPGKCITFGESPDADIRLTDREVGASKNGGVSWFEVNGRFRYQLSLPGRHNAINALTAIAVGRRFGVSDETMSNALGQVDPVAMRFEKTRIGKVDVYNDTYNANPDSVIAALETFAELKPRRRRRVIALGDMLELGDKCEELHREIGRYILDNESRLKIDFVVTVGKHAAYIADELAVKWPAKRIASFRKGNKDTLALLSSQLRDGGAVLLKGSRGVGLDKLVGRLKKTLDLSTKMKKPAKQGKRKKKT